MTTNDNEFYAKNSPKYCCELCDFNTSKKIDYTRHTQTQKHKNNVLTTDENAKNSPKYVLNVVKKNIMIGQDYGDTKRSAILKN